MTDLGAVNGDDCSFFARAINSKGQIVGNSFPCAGGSSRGFLWEHGGPMLDLNTLIPLNPSVQVVDVRNINNRGEIDGTGVLSNGDTHTLLLIPCDDDHQNVKGCDYSMVDTAEVANNAVAPRSQAIPPTMDSLERRINPFQNWCVWTAPAKSHGRLLIGIT